MTSPMLIWMRTRSWLEADRKTILVSLSMKPELTRSAGRPLPRARPQSSVMRARTPLLDTSLPSYTHVLVSFGGGRGGGGREGG